MSMWNIDKQDEVDELIKQIELIDVNNYTTEEIIIKIINMITIVNCKDEKKEVFKKIEKLFNGWIDCFHTI